MKGDNHMKNELVIWIDGTMSYIYFKTNQTKAEHALAEFDTLMDRVGVDTCNVNISEIELRDANTNETIDRVVY